MAGISSEETRTARLELVWGADGIARLQQATVMVLGCGGVGSNCIEALARGGVGRLVIVDGDAVAASNINRQAIAFVDTVGERKVAAMRDLVALIDPAIEVIARDAFVLPETLDELMEGVLASCGGRIDVIVDAIDTVASKLALAAWARDHSAPLVSSMGGANKLDPAQLRICDIFETRCDPLARIMRKECRKRGIGSLTVLCSFEEPRTLPVTGSESPAAPETCDGGASETGADASMQSSPRRPILGTVSYLPPIMGQMIAGAVIRMLVDGSTARAIPGGVR